jgi:hypothetical protein
LLYLLHPCSRVQGAQRRNAILNGFSLFRFAHVEAKYAPENQQQVKIHVERNDKVLNIINNIIDQGQVK